MVLLYTRSRTGVNLKSRNVLILCCENNQLANTRAPQVLQRSIMRLVLVGFNVAIELQKRQCTVRSHDSTTDMLLKYNTSHRAIYIASRRSQDSLASNHLSKPKQMSQSNEITFFHSIRLLTLSTLTIFSRFVCFLAIAGIFATPFRNLSW